MPSATIADILYVRYLFTLFDLLGLNFHGRLFAVCYDMPLHPPPWPLSVQSRRSFCSSLGVIAHDPERVYNDYSCSAAFLFTCNIPKPAFPRPSFILFLRITHTHYFDVESSARLSARSRAYTLPSRSLASSSVTIPLVFRY
jgi:hypothetical protein